MARSLVKLYFHLLKTCLITNLRTDVAVTDLKLYCQSHIVS